ncbi:MAG: sodium:solute symporter, partial [Clostridia bacterium]|nr:sodium:solute symporter [Clostridia bacterium]
PFLYGLYWKGVTKAGVIASFIFGVGMELFQLAVSLGWVNIAEVPVLNFVFQNSLYSGVFAMVGGLVLVPIVSLLTKKTLPEGVGKMFLCYNKTATVDVKDSLGK